MPVAQLLARDFGRLPPNVRVVLTTRPEATSDSGVAARVLAGTSAGAGGPKKRIAEMFADWEPFDKVRDGGP